MIQKKLNIRLRLVRQCLAFVILLLGLFSNAVPARATVTTQFAAAMKFYNAGQFDKAVRLLKANVQKYPGHQPSQLLLGRIFYRAGRIAQAGKHFKFVAPDLVPPEAGYEYGVTMFTYNNCTQALSGFAKVASSAREYDLAQFYRGVCHMRARRWQTAEYYLNRARNLPTNLESSRRRLISTVRKQIRAERQGQDMRGTNPYVFVPPPQAPFEAFPDPAAPKAPGTPTAGASNAVAAEKPKKKDKPPAGYSRAITPSLTFKRSANTSENFGTNDNQSETQSTEVKVSYKGRYDFAPRSFGGQSYGLLGLDVGQEAVNTHGTNVVFVASEDDPGNIREQQTSLPNSSVNNGKVTVNPEFGFPATDSLDLTAGYSIKEVYPDMKVDQKSGSHSPYASASLGFGTITLKLSVSEIDTIGVNAAKQGGQTTKQTTVLGGEVTKSFDNGLSLAASLEQRSSTPVGDPDTNGCNPDTMRRCSVMTIGLDMTKNWESFSLALAIDQVSYTPPANQPKPGEDSSLKTELSGTENFDFGGSLSVTGAMTQLDNYKKTIDNPDPAAPKDESGAAPKVLVTSSGTIQKGTVAFKLSPFDWVYGKISYSVTKNEYQITKGNEFTAAFQNVTPELQTEFVLELGLSKTF